MNKKLKIAQIAPFWFDVPPKDYGGTERIVSYITEELVKRGHEVTLFASENSNTKAKLITPISSDMLKHIEFYCDTKYTFINTYVNYYVFSKADDFDIIHSHSYFYSLPFCDFVKIPTIHTLHSQLPRASEAENEVLRKFRHFNFISISNEFRNHFDLNYIATVYHGLPLDLFPFSIEGGQNLLWIGRASKNKGEDDAIEVTKKTGRKLVMAASIRKDTVSYFNQFIKPKLNQSIEFAHNVKFEDTPKYYGTAKIFLFPVKWKEPFGLILIESLACGTPVVAYARGSIPEIIKDGETGFIVNPSESEILGNWIIKKTGIEGLCEAVERIYSLPEAQYRQMRKNCRAHAEKNFTVEKMVDKYEQVYEKLIR